MSMHAYLCDCGSLDMKVKTGDNREVDSLNGKTVLPPGPIDPELTRFIHKKPSKLREVEGGTSAYEEESIRELGVSEVALLLDVSLPTARKQMTELRSRYGDEVVYTRGNRLFTTAGALAKAMSPKSRQEIRDILDLHSDRLDELEKRLDMMSDRLDVLSTSI